MADRGLDSWTNGLSERERIRHIATTLFQPRSAEWIQKEAGVSSRQTTKEVLDLLVEFRQVRSVGDENQTKYEPNHQVRYINEVLELINTHTQTELLEEIETIQETIEGLKNEFDVESRQSLESTLTDDELTSEDIRERNRVLRQWEQCDENIRLLDHALELYEDAKVVKPQ